MKNRYILMEAHKKIGEAPSIQALAQLIGCTRAHIYHSYSPINGVDTFKFKNINYQIIDKLT